MPDNDPVLSEARRYLIALLLKDCVELRWRARIATALDDTQNAEEYLAFAKTLADVGDALVARFQSTEGARFGAWTPTLIA